MMRALNIGLRTAHIAAMAVLVGGHAFAVSPHRLMPSLWLTLGTGAALALMESGAKPLWLHQGRGLVTLAKLGLLSLVPLAWELRLPILLTVIVIASVGSHMSSRFRYYSVLHRQVIHDGFGPGRRRAQEGAPENGETQEEAPENGEKRP